MGQDDLAERRAAAVEDGVLKMRGPTITGHVVFIDGREVPHIKMVETESGAVRFILRDAIIYEFPRDMAVYAARFVADAMAIACGYPCFESERRPEAFAHKAAWIGELP